MTLEKLLIFGFAIAVMTTLTVVATNTAEDRHEPYETYKDKVETLVDKNG